ncbi:Uncharacterized protein TCM_014271 [Theobroma cacao]|uniref:Secreted protein n=1 Tax=Theobroma cacao TaxID=3641 RepID=A0A061G4W8_THECC|nr:Uncharacterized protein TCM_014271 [Theobroma cacao]
MLGLFAMSATHWFCFLLKTLILASLVVCNSMPRRHCLISGHLSCQKCSTFNSWDSICRYLSLFFLLRCYGVCFPQTRQWVNTKYLRPHGAEGVI